MILKFRLYIVFLCCFHGWIQGQNSLANISERSNYERAISMYNFGQYDKAQFLFSNLKNHSINPKIVANAAYYNVVCAIRLNQAEAQNHLEDFLENYTTSPRRNIVYLEAGDYYFNRTKFAYAKKWYQNVEPELLNDSQKEQFFFNYGYANYQTDNFQLAHTFFKKIEYSKNYGSQARYYMGYMAYKQDDYDTANLFFQDAEVDQQYKEELRYFKADLKFKLGAFQEAIDTAKEALDGANPNETSELKKIIGESYFNLKKYEQAIPFLKQYKGKNGQWTQVDFYQLGYAYYKNNLYREAISEFNKIIESDNALAQNAYYHLGECYIKNNQKQEALNAFKSASELNYDSKIKEDSWLNYAKLSYDIGNPYMSSSVVLMEFLKTYPKSPFRNEIETLLVDSYVSSKNYKDALQLLESNMQNNLKPTYQKVAFFRALELYGQNKLSEAKTLLKNTISLGIDPEITARAYYWTAEIEFNQLNFNSAIEGYLTFKSFSSSKSNWPEIKHLDYNLGYTYFKLKKYSEAITAFQNYCSKSSSDELIFNDALMRMADAYYVTKQFKKAIEYYNAVVENKNPVLDYALFQIATSYGFLGQIDNKISTLKSILKNKNSKYLDEVNFEMANTYNTLNKPILALEYYNNVINDFPQSSLVSKALLRKGLLLYNRSENNQALEVFKQVADRYPATPEAYQAISSVRTLYIENGQVDDYAQWVGTLTYASASDVKLEKTAFEAAEKQYLENNAEKAISLFNSYLQKYPNNSSQNKAHFYLAELYYNKGLIENALPHYEFIINKPNSEFTENALLKVCEIALEKNINATSFLKRLEQESKNPQNILFAQSNLMKLFFDNEDYIQAIEYADIVYDDLRSNKTIKNDALIVKARSAMAQKNDGLAEVTYQKIDQSSSGILGAEASYFLAYFKHNAGKFEASNNLIQNLIKIYPNQKRFAAKGLILMAQNFYALNDTFQATYILESVIKNFKTFETIVDTAEILLEDYRKAIQKTNASVKLTTKSNNNPTEQNDEK